MTHDVTYVLIFLCILPINRSMGKMQDGTINSHKDVVFMDSFAYGTDNVNFLRFKFFFPSNLHSYELAMFDDSVNQWPFIRQNEESLSCMAKVSKIIDPSFKVNLTETSDQCKVTWKSKEKWLLCRGYKDFSSSKMPHRYFFNLANCYGEVPGIWNVTYTLHMTNGLKTLEWEFSYDQRYLMVTDLGFLFSYLGILLVATINHVTLFRKHLLHVTYRLFYLSVNLQLISLLLHCLALGHFSDNGVGLPSLNNSADILYGLSSVVFVALLVLVSKGYTVTRARMSINGSIQLAILCILYAVSYLIFFIYQNILVDPRDILAQYSIKVAAGPVICRITGLIWTLHGVYFTVKRHHDKLAFYLPFACFFSLWFMIEPVSLILATSSVFHKMDSSLILNGLQLLTAFLGHTYFLFLTMPVTLNKSFPFHLPVSKVGVLPLSEGVGSLYKPNEDHYDVFSNGSLNSARGTVKCVNSSSSDPVILPPVFLHDTSFDEQRRQSVNTRVASTMLTTRLAMPTPPKECTNEPHHLPVTSPSNGFSVFCVMAEACNPQQLPYKMTPILPYDDGIDDIEDIEDDISVVSLGLDVFNKPLPGDDLNRIPRFPPPTKLPKLKIPGKKKPSRSPVKTPRSNDAIHNFQAPTTKLAWSGSLKKEKKRLKRLTKLTKFSEIKLPGIKTTRVTKIDL